MSEEEWEELVVLALEQDEDEWTCSSCFLSTGCGCPVESEPIELGAADL